MPPIIAPKPSRLDQVDGESITAIVRDSTSVSFLTRLGALVTKLVIRNTPVLRVKAITTLKSFDTTSREVLIKGWYRKNSPNVRLADLPSLPSSGATTDPKWSPDGVYLAFAHSVSPYITVYKRSFETFTKLSNPASLPAAQPSQIAWSPDGQYLAVTYTSAPGLEIYQRSGDTLTKLSGNPAITPGGASSLSWSPDGQYLTIGRSPIWDYKITGGTFAKSTETPTVPGLAVLGLAWSNISSFLAVFGGSGYDGSVYYNIVTLYTRNGDVINRISTTIGEPNVAQASAGTWSPDDSYLAVVAGAVLYVFKRNGTAFSELAVPQPVNGTFVISDVAWSVDGNYLAIAQASGNYVSIYKRTGDIFTELPALPYPDNFGQGVGWSPDGRYLALTQFDVPHVSVYKSAMVPIPGAAVRLP